MESKDIIVKVFSGYFQRFQYIVRSCCSLQIRTNNNFVKLSDENGNSVFPSFRIYPQHQIDRSVTTFFVVPYF